MLRIFILPMMSILQRAQWLFSYYLLHSWSVWIFSPFRTSTYYIIHGIEN